MGMGPSIERSQRLKDAAIEARTIRKLLALSREERRRKGVRHNGAALIRRLRELESLS